DFMAFSRSGLIKQLEFEGFSTADATFAVDTVDVDWMVQAEKSAQSYLDFTSFSRSGLIDQLEFEGFTSEQARHGADSVGL
ncbi:Ltp family lipoprotein, partial [Pseudonocardia abyssalis]